MANNLPQNAITELIYSLKCAHQAMGAILEHQGKEENYRNIAENEYAIFKQKEKERKKELALPFLLFIPCLLPTWFFLMIIYGVLEELAIIPVDYPLVWLVVGIAAIALTAIGSAIWFVFTYKNRSYLNHLKEAKKSEKAADSQRALINKIIEDNREYLSIIAPEFRFLIALKYLIQLFEQGRATSLPEAYDKLELRLHQMKVEEGLTALITLQMAQLAVLERIEYNTSWIQYK